MEPLFAKSSWAGAKFLAVSLIVTFMVSRILLLLLAKVVSDRFARNLIAKSFAFGSSRVTEALLAQLHVRLLDGPRRREAACRHATHLAVSEAIRGYPAERIGAALAPPASIWHGQPRAHRHQVWRRACVAVRFVALHSQFAPQFPPNAVEADRSIARAGNDAAWTAMRRVRRDGIRATGQSSRFRSAGLILYSSIAAAARSACLRHRPARRTQPATI
jgi:hypothetical protein